MPSAESNAKRNAYLRDLRKNGTGNVGVAKFLMPDDPAWNDLLTPSGLMVGRTSEGDAIYLSEGHMTAAAPTGSGKGVSLVNTALLTYPGSVVSIDPTGVAAAVTAQHRARMGQRVYINDPYNLPGSAGANNRFLRPYDPISSLDPLSSQFLEHWWQIADALIINEDSEKGGSFFADKAKSWLAGLGLFMFTMPPEMRTFSTLVDLAYSNLDDVKEQIAPKMRGSDAFGGALSKIGNSILGSTKDMMSNVFTTIQRSLDLWVMSPNLIQSMRPSEVNFADLKGDTPVTIYLCLPADKLETHGRYLRLLLSIAVRQNMDSRRPAHDLLLLIDEAASLGRMQQLETGISIFRQYGIRMTTIFQDMDQMKRIYPNFQTWFANSALVSAFGVNDNFTASYLSEKAGVTSVNILTSELELQKQRGGSTTVHSRPLLTPDEIARLPTDQQLLFFRGLDPILCSKLRYFSDPEFRHRDGTPTFDDNPYLKK